MEGWREMLAVGLVLGLLGAGLYLLRRFRLAPAAVAGPLRVVTRVRLSEGLVLHLVECAGERCLVTEQKAHCSVVRLGAPASPATREEPAC